jgi:hypothetical protein
MDFESMIQAYEEAINKLIEEDKEMALEEHEEAKRYC